MLEHDQIYFSCYCSVTVNTEGAVHSSMNDQILILSLLVVLQELVTYEHETRRIIVSADIVRMIIVTNTYSDFNK